MAGGVVDAPVRSLSTAQDVNQIEAPVTWKAYLICAFASFGGIFFGYDSGYINGCLASPLFIEAVAPGQTSISSSHTSLIVSILSAGTFFGALIGGDCAEFIGRKWTVISGCFIYMIGVVVQMITGNGHGLGVIVAGRLIAGIGVGFESAIVILYMSEIVSCSKSSFALMLMLFKVPQEGPRCPGCRIPILHHNRSPHCRLRCLRNQK